MDIKIISKENVPLAVPKQQKSFSAKSKFSSYIYIFGDRRHWSVLREVAFEYSLFYFRRFGS